VRNKVLIGVVALFAVVACSMLLGMSLNLLAGSMSIPFLDPHSIPFLDPHSIPFLDPHSIPFLDPHAITV
ncbi:MAG: hypothetical protein MIO90_07280, partial [Methanomassiliicoccales archaeon]|nr:hypothetical protein [Methanomassiliicoccales archaeon]